jgi:hypothetical protein
VIKKTYVQAIKDKVRRCIISCDEQRVKGEEIGREFKTDKYSLKMGCENAKLFLSEPLRTEGTVESSNKQDLGKEEAINVRAWRKKKKKEI